MNLDGKGGYFRRCAVIRDNQKFLENRDKNTVIPDCFLNFMKWRVVECRVRQYRMSAVQSPPTIATIHFSNVELSICYHFIFFPLILNGYLLDLLAKQFKICSGNG